MSEFRKIDPTPFLRALDEGVMALAGSMPDMRWIEVNSLVVETAYQRKIERAGTRNIIGIARNFNWLKFGTIVVCALPGGKLFAVVDGQHRATAAALRGVAKVPCQIVKATLEERAEAFAGLNSDNVTKMSPLQVHAARAAAGNKFAVALDKACAKAGVRICRTTPSWKDLKVGETVSASQLAALFVKFSEDVFVDALKCITKTGDGNVGLVRAPIVEALCVVIEAEREWRGEPLVRAMVKFDLRAAVANASGNMNRRELTASLVEAVADHLDKTFRKAA